MTGGLVIEGGTILPMGDQPVIPHGHVVAEGQDLTHVGPGAPPAGSIPPGAVSIDARGCAVLPGLVNTHAHFRPMRAVGDGLGFMDWHDRYVHEFANRMTPQDAYVGAAATFVEMLRNGITTVQGMSSITVVEPEEVLAAQDVGIRARLVPHAGTAEHLRHTIEQIEARPGSEEDRVRVWLGLEVPQLFTIDDLRTTATAAERFAVGVHTHFSEVERDDLGPLVDSGLLARGLSLAHCVHLDDSDIENLAQRGVSVAHNPKSNMRYGNGVAPVVRMRRAGINVGLGTDAPDSTFSCDLFEEARAATLLARVTSRDPRVLTAEDALRLATTGGAEALGLETQIGSLRVGARADVAVVPLEAPHLVPHIVEGPHRNIFELLVFAARGADVRDVVVDGRTVMRDRRISTVDEGSLLAECQARGARILADM